LTLRHIIDTPATDATLITPLSIYTDIDAIDIIIFLHYCLADIIDRLPLLLMQPMLTHCHYAIDTYYALLTLIITIDY
jgi:hypothetical protein